MTEIGLNALEFLGIFDSVENIPSDKVKLGTIVLINKDGDNKEYICSGFDTYTKEPIWSEIYIAPMGRPDVLDFIKKFKEGAIDKSIDSIDRYIKSICIDAVETLFYDGYCYWFARILKERFDGTIVYSQIDNHFACLIEDYYYDIKGCIGSVYDLGIFVDWEKYKKLDKSDTQRIYRDCIMKLGDGPIDKENNTCMGIELKVYNEEEELV